MCARWRRCREFSRGARPRQDARRSVDSSRHDPCEFHVHLPSMRRVPSRGILALRRVRRLCGGHAGGGRFRLRAEAGRSQGPPGGAAAGNAGLFLILGLIIGGAIGYVLHGAAGPRGEGGMPRGPADVMRGSAAAGDDGASGMAGGMGGGGGMGGEPGEVGHRPRCRLRSSPWCSSTGRRWPRIPTTSTRT